MSGKQVTKSQLGCLSAILTVAGFAFIMVGMHDFRLAREGVHVQGVVTAVHPEIHNSINYKFDYNGSTYNGTGHRLAEETVGTPVTVYFESAHPEFSLSTDPTGEGWGNVMPGLFALAVAFIVLCALHFFSQTKKKA